MRARTEPFTENWFGFVRCKGIRHDDSYGYLGMQFRACCGIMQDKDGISAHNSQRDTNTQHADNAQTDTDQRLQCTRGEHKEKKESAECMRAVPAQPRAWPDQASQIFQLPWSNEAYPKPAEGGYEAAEKGCTLPDPDPCAFFLLLLCVPTLPSRQDHFLVSEVIFPCRRVCSRQELGSGFHPLSHDMESCLPPQRII